MKRDFLCLNPLAINELLLINTRGVYMKVRPRTALGSSICTLTCQTPSKYIFYGNRYGFLYDKTYIQIHVYEFRSVLWYAQSICTKYIEIRSVLLYVQKHQSTCSRYPAYTLICNNTSKYVFTNFEMYFDMAHTWRCVFTNLYTCFGLPDRLAPLRF